ncbi:MAG: DUF3800 domain-containing protein [Patescibacteria group bacterium]
MFIFLDESGNFKKYNHEEYFVIGSFTIGNQRRTSKSVKSWFREKFPRLMCKQNEIKWSQSGIDEALRLRTIRHITQMDIRIRFGYLLRKNIPETYQKKGKISSGVLYTNIICEVLSSYFPTDDKQIYIFCDRRSLKGMTKKEFESAVLTHLIPLCTPDTLIQVDMVDSTTNPNIQIADWISGAFSHYLEKKPGGDEYHKALKNSIIGAKEFFTSDV